MVLLRSLPEFSTMCISAIDFVGDAMNCKVGSIIINCNYEPSAWCDSRDEVPVDEPSSSLSSPFSCKKSGYNYNNNSNSNSNISVNRDCKEDLSTRYSDRILDTPSLSSSVHQLLHDSSERESQHTTRRQTADDNAIFRTKTAISQGSSNKDQYLRFCQLNRCTAWAQDDSPNYSFYDDDDGVAVGDTKGSEKVSSVRMVHWDEIVHDSLQILDTSNSNNEDNSIFRSTGARTSFSIGMGNQCLSLCRLDRCAAWSMDDSSSIIDSRFRSIPEQLNRNNSEAANLVHWDDLVINKIV